jgi:hypothetical protein
MDVFRQRSWEQDAQLGLALFPLEHQELLIVEDILAVPIYLKELVSPLHYYPQLLYFFILRI